MHLFCQVSLVSFTLNILICDPDMSFHDINASCHAFNVLREHKNASKSYHGFIDIINKNFVVQMFTGQQFAYCYILRFSCFSVIPKSVP